MLMFIPCTIALYITTAIKDRKIVVAIMNVRLIDFILLSI